MVMVENFADLISVRINACNFLRGLHISTTKAGSFYILSCKMSSLDFCHNTQFERAFIDDVEVENSLSLSGLTVTEGIALKSVTFKDLILKGNEMKAVVKATLVQTDDPVVAYQFKMFGVPIIVSTKAAVQALKGEGLISVGDV